MINSQMPPQVNLSLQNLKDWKYFLCLINNGKMSEMLLNTSILILILFNFIYSSNFNFFIYPTIQQFKFLILSILFIYPTSSLKSVKIRSSLYMLISTTI